MAKQSKNDSSIRNLLLKSGSINPSFVNQQSTRRDPKASMMAAINARKAEFLGKA